MEYVCAICGKPISRWNALRIGGMVEQATKKQFICRACCADVHAGKIEFKLVSR